MVLSNSVALSSLEILLSRSLCCIHCERKQLGFRVTADMHGERKNEGKLRAPGFFLTLSLIDHFMYKYI